MPGGVLAPIHRPLQSADCSYYLPGSKGAHVTFAEVGGHPSGHLSNLTLYLAKIMCDLAEVLNRKRFSGATHVGVYRRGKPIDNREKPSGFFPNRNIDVGIARE